MVIFPPSMPRNSSILLLLTTFGLALANNAPTGANNKEGYSSLAPPILPRFQFLDKVNDDVCPCFNAQEAPLKDFWLDEDFLKWIDDYMPDQYEASLSGYVDKIVKYEMDQITLYFQKVKQAIVQNFGAARQGFLVFLIEKYSKEALQLYIEIFEGKKCAEHSKRLKNLLEKLKALNAIDSFAAKIQATQFSDKFYLNFYLEASECKDLVRRSIFTNVAAAKPKIEELWKLNDFDKGAKELLKSTYKPEKTDPRSYVKYLDYTAFNPRDYDSSDIFHSDISFFNLSVFNPLFALYDVTYQQIFVALYEVIVDFRIKNKDTVKGKNQIEIMKLFDLFLDQYDFQKFPKYYLIFKIFLYQVFDATTGKLDIKFREKYEVDNPTIKILAKRYNLKSLIKILVKKYKVPIKINDFEDLMEDNQRKDYLKNIPVYFDAKVKSKANLKEDDYEFREYLDDLIANNKPEDTDFENKVREGILLYIFNSNIYLALTNADLMNIIKEVFYKLMEKKQIRVIELYKTIFRLVSTEKLRLSLSYEKFLEYFKTVNAQKALEPFIPLVSKQTESNKNMQAFCNEVASDFKTFANADVKICNNPVTADPFANFFQHFIKLRSFVLSFEYLVVTKPKILDAYHHIYRYIAMNKATYVNESVQGLVKKLDSFLSSLRSLPEITKNPLYPTYKRIVDLVRLINIANVEMDEKAPGVLLELDFSAIYFSELIIFINFFEEARSKNLENLLETAFKHTKLLKNFYHLNNLYLIINMSWIYVDNNSNAPQLKSKAKELLSLVNNPDLKDTAILTRRIRVSKYAAFMYLIEYKLKHSKEKGYNQYLELLKEELRALTNEDITSFFALYFYENINTLNLEKFASKELKVEVISKDTRAFFLKSFFDEFKSQEVSKTELFVYLTYDLFNYLVDNGHFEFLWKEKLTNYMIEYVLQLSQRDQPETYTEQFENLLKGYQSFDLQNSNYLYAVAYYLLGKGVVYINQSKQAKVDQTEFNETINNFVKFFATNNFKSPRSEAEEEYFDYRFNIKNLYVSLVFVFARRFPTDKFALAASKFDLPMNIQTAAYFLAFSPADRARAKDIKNDYTGKIAADAEKFMKSPDKFKFVNYLNAEFKKIFYVTCAHEEFGVFLKANQLKKTMKNDIDSIKSGCLQSSDNSTIKREGYNLLSAVISTAEDIPSEDKEGQEVLKSLFTEIGKVLKTKLKINELLGVYKKVIVREVTVLVHPDFQNFIDEVFKSLKMDGISKVFDQLASEKIVDPSLKQISMYMCLKDYLIFSNFASNQFTLNDLDSFDLFEVMRQKSKFLVFLSSLFINFKPKDQETVKSYLELYLMILNFRLTRVQKLNFVSQRDTAIVDEVKKSFESYLISIFNSKEQVITKLTKTKAYYVYLVHRIYSKDVLAFEQKQEEQCQMLEDVEKLSQFPFEGIDEAAFNNYINYNPDIVQDLKFYISKLDDLNNFYLKYRYVQLPDCASGSKEGTMALLQPWLAFFQKFVKVDPNENVSFVISSQIKALTYTEKFRIVL